MKLKAYGTFGSLPVFIPGRTIGGNTSCYRVDSPCLPADTWLVLDGGSGFAVLCADALKAGVKRIIVLLTHYHHDHTQGLLMGAVTYIKGIKVTLVGPMEDGTGPHQMLKAVMSKPFHPRAFQLEMSHFTEPVSFEYPEKYVLLFHPKGGFKHLGIDTYERLCDEGKQLPFRKGEKYSREECLVVKMLTTEHPERTISYRLEEGPTNKVAVLLTDHANQDGTSADMKAHLRAIDLLMQDVQYSRKEYDLRATGFGHATPDYAVRLCNAAGVLRVGFIHHHFMWGDEEIEANVTTAQQLSGEIIAQTDDPDKRKKLLTPGGIFLVRDYMEIEV